MMFIYIEIDRIFYTDHSRFNVLPDVVGLLAFWKIRRMRAKERIVTSGLLEDFSHARSPGKKGFSDSSERGAASDEEKGPRNMEKSTKNTACSQTGDDVCEQAVFLVQGTRRTSTSDRGSRGSSGPESPGGSLEDPRRSSPNEEDSLEQEFVMPQWQVLLLTPVSLLIALVVLCSLFTDEENVKNKLPHIFGGGILIGLTIGVVTHIRRHFLGRRQMEH